jgi:DNA-binding GntR family transcriptional regulator
MYLARNLTMGETSTDEAADSRDTIQRVVLGVLFGIRSGQMVPGQHLVEADLARQLGVSRGSLREGLKRLEADGIVTLTRYRGAFISTLDRKGVGDLLDVLELLCGLAARQAAEHCRSDAAKQQLLALASELGHRASDSGGRADYLTRRHEFYDQLIAMGGSGELGRVIPLARADLFRSQFDRVQSREQRRKHANGYLKIAEAVALNDPAKAERAVRKHFAATRAAVDVMPDQAFSMSLA